MEGRNTIRMTSSAGLGVVALFVLGGIVLPLTDAPPSNASATQVALYATHHRGAILAAIYLAGLGFGLFLLFAGGLRNLLGRAAGEGCSAPAIGLGGAVAAVATLLAGFAAFGAAAYRVADPGLVRALFDFGWATFAFSGFPTAVALGAFSFVIWRQRYLHPGIAAFGALVAALHLLAAAAFTGSSGALSLEGDVAIYVPVTFYAWVLIVSVGLARRDAATTA